jgi:hypothetical protein
MKTTAGICIAVVLASTPWLTGCAAPNVDFSTIQRPQRAVELDAFEAFVGSWKWEAKLLNTEGEDEKWTGRAEWSWALDKRCLQGHLWAEGAHASFEAEGIWSWHPKAKRYTWWMFNNWGYPQQGTASYDADAKSWRMPYKSVGLDGSGSYGIYTMEIIDQDTLEWTMTEWADALHMVKKMEMTGTYTRQ